MPYKSVEKERERCRRYYAKHRKDIVERRDCLPAKPLMENQKEEKKMYDTAYYAANRSRRKVQNAEYHRAHREEIASRIHAQQVWFALHLRNIKAAQGCHACGTRVGRLHHHHIDPETKKYSLSKMCAASLEKFINEIAKCTVLCVPCHAAQHVNMRAKAAFQQGLEGESKT